MNAAPFVKMRHNQSRIDHPITLKYKRVVAKAGTGVLTSESGKLDLDAVADLVRQLAYVHNQGVEVLLVTSGAVAVGGSSIPDFPFRKDIGFRQVLAAIGQGRLMGIYENLFSTHDITIAQALLTWKDLSDRQGYLNVRNTLLALIEMRVLPVLNENDVVASDEIGEVFGDNDKLSALVANLVDADLLVILSDIDGLYTSDPRVDPEAKLIREVERVDGSIEALAGKHRNPETRGGMPTKLDAIRSVTAAGVPAVVCDGRNPRALIKLINGEQVGTLFAPTSNRMESRKKWMLSGLSKKGTITVDKGATLALLNHQTSLLPAGISRVQGTFGRGDIVSIVTSGGEEIACGIANYSSADIEYIKGTRSNDINALLGYQYGAEVVHRNNMVVL